MNQNLKQLGRQLLAIWNQLGLNQKISVVLAFGVVVLGLGALGFFSTRTDYELLFSRLDSREAAKVIAALEEAGVPYQTGGTGANIYVPRNQVNAMRMKLADQISGGDVVGDEILEKSNVMISEAMQQAQLQRARNGELARTISSLDDIESARVRVAQPANRLLQNDPPTASVFVKLRGNRNISRTVVQSITALVANSVEGLKPGNVAVVDNHGNALTAQYEEGSIGGIASGHFDIRQQVETMFTKKVKTMLDEVLGPGQSTVRVAVELNTDSITSTAQIVDPASKVPRSLTTKEETTSSSNGGSDTTPGISANLNLQTNIVSTASSTSNNSKTTTSETVNEFDMTVKQTVQNAGSIKRITAAVLVNTVYDGVGADRKPLSRTPEEIEKLKEVVKSALGIQADVPGGDRNDQITLHEIAFNEQPIIEMNETLEQQHQRDFWIQLAARAAYPALAVIVLFLFVRAFKKTRMEEIPLGVAVGEMDANGQINDLADWKAGGNRPRTVTVDVLNQLVKENPHNMTQAIRSWMNAGAKNN